MLLARLESVQANKEPVGAKNRTLAHLCRIILRKFFWSNRRWVFHGCQSCRGGGASEYILYGSRFNFPSDTSSSQTCGGYPLGGIIPTILDILLPRLRPDSSSSCVSFSFFLNALNALVCSGLIAKLPGTP